MKSLATRERFVELRAAGKSYADISTALSVSKPTMIKWARTMSHAIHNLRTLRLAELYDLYAAAKTRRVEHFGKQLQGILAELDKRTLDKVPTERLHTLALAYADRLRDEAEQPLSFQSDRETIDLDLKMTREEWPA